MERNWVSMLVTGLDDSAVVVEVVACEQEFDDEPRHFCAIFVRPVLGMNGTAVGVAAMMMESRQHRTNTVDNIDQERAPSSIRRPIVVAEVGTWFADKWTCRRSSGNIHTDHCSPTVWTIHWRTIDR